MMPTQSICFLRCLYGIHHNLKWIDKEKMKRLRVETAHELTKVTKLGDVRVGI